MESVRRHIESQVLSLTGLAVGGVDFESPKGDPGLFGPDAACWKGPPPTARWPMPSD